MTLSRIRDAWRVLTGKAEVARPSSTLHLNFVEGSRSVVAATTGVTFTVPVRFR